MIILNLLAASELKIEGLQVEKKLGWDLPNRLSQYCANCLTQSGFFKSANCLSQSGRAKWLQIAILLRFANWS